VDRNMGVVSVPFHRGAVHRLANMGSYKQRLILGT
jgi:hypothetical protein